MVEKRHVLDLQDLIDSLSLEPQTLAHLLSLTFTGWSGELHETVEHLIILPVNKNYTSAQ